MEQLQIKAVAARNKKYNNCVVTLEVSRSYSMNGRMIYAGTCTFKGIAYVGTFDSRGFNGVPTLEITKADNLSGNPVWFDHAENVTAPVKIRIKAVNNFHAWSNHNIGAEVTATYDALVKGYIVQFADHPELQGVPHLAISGHIPVDGVEFI